MNSFFKTLNTNELWWGASAIVVGAYFAASTIAWNRWTVAGWPRPAILIAFTGLAFGIMLLGKVRGARWMGIAWLASIAVTQVLDSFALAWDLGAIAGVALLLLATWYFYAQFFADQYNSTK